MAIGVLIVLIYVWSGESIIALILSIMTLFAALAVWQWQPWVVSGDADGPSVRPAQTELLPTRPSTDRQTTESVWRSSFDITYDERGVSGVAVGSQAPQMWSWSQIDDIDHHWCALEHGDDQLEERLALRLFFPDLRNPEEPVQAWVMFGPTQEPEEVEREARATWRDSKVKKSRLFELTPHERTLKLAEQAAPGRLNLTDWPRSPELLYQELRRELLSGGELCRLPHELARDGGGHRIASLHRPLDWIAEQRGFRVMFIDHRNSRAGDDYLIGLIPAGSADDWDGQTVGSGSARIMLDRPS